MLPILLISLYLPPHFPPTQQIIIFLNFFRVWILKYLNCFFLSNFKRDYQNIFVSNFTFTHEERYQNPKRAPERERKNGKKREDIFLGLAFLVPYRRCTYDLRRKFCVWENSIFTWRDGFYIFLGRFGSANANIIFLFVWNAQRMKNNIKYAYIPIAFIFTHSMLFSSIFSVLNI